MHVVPQGNTMYFDVDDTLIYWDDETLCSQIKDLSEQVTINLNGLVLRRYVIQENVREIMLQKASGCHVVVWSASGSQWAEAVVKALALEDFVDVVISKPYKYYDDKSSSEWMPAKRRHFGELFKS